MLTKDRVSRIRCCWARLFFDKVNRIKDAIFEAYERQPPSLKKDLLRVAIYTGLVLFAFVMFAVLLVYVSVFELLEFLAP